MAVGVAWMVLVRLAARLLGLISTVILARLLIPEDFGLVAMAMSVIAVLELLGYFSFDAMLIQKQQATRADYDTAWTLNVLFGTIAALILLVVAYPAAAFYSEPRLTPIMLALAIKTLVGGFQNIGTVDFRKHLQFDREFLFTFLPRLAGFVLTIVAAWVLRSYWALIMGMVLNRMATVALSYYMHPFRPRFSLASSRELFNFSKWLFVVNAFDLLWLRSADFIIGRFSGARALGLFAISYEVSNLPTTELSQPINRAVFPGYAKMATDFAALRQGYLNVLMLIALLALPAGFGIAAVSEQLVAVMLGAKWHDAAPLIALLAIYGATNAMLTNTGTVFIALGRPEYLAYVSVVRAGVLVPALVLVVPESGALGAAWTYLVVALVFMPLIFGMLFRLIQLPIGRFVRDLWRPVAATALMFGAVHLYLQGSDPTTGLLEPLQQLISAVALGVAVYGTAIALLWLAAGRPDGGEQFMLNRLISIYQGATRK